MSDKDKEFLSIVDEVLHYLWDPIGISGESGARDEYRSYALQVFSLFKQEKDAREISIYLEEIVRDRMDLVPNKENCDYITEVLINYKDYIFNG